MKQFKEIFANFRNELENVRADGLLMPGEPEDDDEEDGEEEKESCSKEEFEMAMEYLNRRLAYIEEDFYNYVNWHSKGHLPPINSAEQMKRALDALGLSEEYEVAQKVIYSKEGKIEKFIFEVKNK